MLPGTGKSNWEIFSNFWGKLEKNKKARFSIRGSTVTTVVRTRAEGRCGFAIMSSKSTKSTLTFPLIKNKEIIACMRGLEIPLTMDDIKNPTQQKMKEICEGFLMHFMGLSREELRMPIFSATTKNIFEFRQLHEDSVYEFSTYFFMYVQRCACARARAVQL